MKTKILLLLALVSLPMYAQKVFFNNGEIVVQDKSGGFRTATPSPFYLDFPGKLGDTKNSIILPLSDYSQMESGLFVSSKTVFGYPAHVEYNFDVIDYRSGGLGFQLASVTYHFESIPFQVIVDELNKANDGIPGTWELFVPAQTIKTDAGHSSFTPPDGFQYSYVFKADCGEYEASLFYGHPGIFVEFDATDALMDGFNNGTGPYAYLYK